MLKMILRFRTPIIVVLSIFTIFTGWLALNLRMDMGMYTLLPQDDEEVRVFQEISENFGGFDNLTVVLEAEDKTHMKNAADDIAKQASKLDEVVKDVDYRIPVSFIEDNFLLYIDQENFDHFIVTANEDPFALLDYDLDEIREQILAEKQAYNYSPDENKLLLFLRPTNPDHDMIFFEKMVTDVEVVLHELMEDHPEASYELTGMAKMMEEQQDYLSSRVIMVSLAALVLIFTMFIIIYRRFMVPLLATLPIGIALIWTMGFTQLVVGRLNVVTSIFAVILLGLGIDLSIHFVTKFFHEIDNGKSVLESLEKVYLHAIPGITAGAITTAISFYVLMISDFQGLSELGFIAGTGILMCYISVTVLLPCVLSFLYRNHVPTKNLRKSRSFDYTTLLFRWKSVVFAVIGLVIVIPYLTGFNLAFNYNTFSLLPDIPSVRTQETLMDEFDSSFEYSILRADTLEEARLQYDQVLATDIYSIIDSPVLLIPEGQLERLQIIEETHQSLKDHSITDTEEGQALLSMLSTVINHGEITLDRLPNSTRDKYIGLDGSIGTYVFGTRNMWEEDEMKATVEELRAIDEDVSGTPFMWVRVVDYIQRDLFRSTIAVLLAIILVLSINLRSTKYVLFAMMPVVVGFLWLLGVMSFFEIRFNASNIAALPLILGIGIDDGIHMIHSYRSHDNQIRPMLQQTGKAVLVTSLTSMIGFGLLYFVYDPLVSGLGVLLALGVLFCLIISVTLLPMALNRFDSQSL